VDTDEGYNECYDICEPSFCCTAPGDDSCLGGNLVVCLEYLPCAVLAVTGGELEDPPDNIVSVCSLPSVLTTDGCAECRCICEDAACCTAEDDDNCFYKSNAEACTKWILACAVLVFGKCADNVACNGGGNSAEPEAFEVIDPEDLVFLASDDLEGRDNPSPGSNKAQEYLIKQLEPIAVGLNFGRNGSDAFKQGFSEGTNILAVIEGSELPNEYVILGAHYDHVSICTNAQTATSTICNGATDNAAGVAIVLGIGRSIAKLTTRPKRSLVLAFWDAEEDGLLGSAHYANNPLVPLNSSVAYLNWETLGLNLLPSLRNFSFAIGAETGGDELQDALARSIADEGLGMRPVSLIFGLGRSDHQTFADVNIPTVFFSDATGGCYHTTGDEIGVVNFPKLEKEARIGLKLTLDLANTATPPIFETGLEEVIFDDAVAFSDLANRIDTDLNLFSFKDQVLAKVAQFLMIAIVAYGSDYFDRAQMVTTLLIVHGSVLMLTRTECDGFLLPS
jgi:hypothetical protein